MKKIGKPVEDLLVPEGRALVRNSFDVVTYEPGPSREWDAAYERYLELIA